MLTLFAGDVTEAEVNVAKVEDGEGATGVVAWEGGAPVDGKLLLLPTLWRLVQYLMKIAEADTEAGATVVVLWSEIVNATTVPSFLTISYK